MITFQICLNESVALFFFLLNMKLADVMCKSRKWFDPVKHYDPEIVSTDLRIFLFWGNSKACLQGKYSLKVQLQKTS